MKRAGPLSYTIIEDKLAAVGSPKRFMVLVLAGSDSVVRIADCATAAQARAEGKAAIAELEALKGEDVVDCLMEGSCSSQG